MPGGTLDGLLQDMAAAPEVYRPSPFWEELARVAVGQLDAGGFEHFKRSVNMAYFNWNAITILQHQFLPMLWHWCRHPVGRLLDARFGDYRYQPPHAPTFQVSDFRLRLPAVATFNPVTAAIYRFYVALLFEYVSRDDRLGLLTSLDEPSIGHPFAIEYRGRRTSQDLCNSVHEFYSASGPDALAMRNPQIAELGAGYGRLAYVFLRAVPSCSYTIIDIPPALHVAQEYLTRVFPDLKAFRFRPFHDYESVRGEFESSQIRFLAAHQIERIPRKSFDWFLNISSLHEMTMPQITNYFHQIDRLCRGRFYTKQWRRARTPVNGHRIGQYEYPVPASWARVFHQRHPIQRMFFHALYSLPQS
jgi:putative sugar O-methyltransferase